MHILTLTTLFPSSVRPMNAVFVRARMQKFTRRHGHRWTVVAPVPYFPKLPVVVSANYDAFARTPHYEEPWGYPVYHPRYLVTPMIGMRFYGTWMTWGIRKLIRQLHAKDPFDMIDAHYIYPDGTAATRIGQELRLPVVLSARGTDLNLYPSIPGISPLLRSNLEASKHVICVCNELKQVALDFGTPADKVSVIGNGVDASRFHSGDRLAARRALGLPEDATIVLSVGHMTERKGFQLLTEAYARLGRVDVILVIVGDGEQRAELEALRSSLGLEDRIHFPGAVRNEHLPPWYQAADVFVLASSREGWPNVLCEAQACGLPAVATKVWGIPEIVHNDRLGVLIDERNAEGLHAGLETALPKTWNRDYIAATGQARTWEAVADDLVPIFNSVVTN